MTDTNRCQADWIRRERAMQDNGVSERFGEFTRRIEFQVGYDHREFPEDCGGGGHGQHGMQMRFVLIGPRGAVQWMTAMTNWVPGNVELDLIANVSLVPCHHKIRDGYAVDLGYHAPERPAWDTGEHMVERKCDLLPGGTCFYDGSGLAAEDLVPGFLDHGPHAVWAALARHYATVFHDDTTVARGATDE
jgi:hypothetical protein